MSLKAKTITGQEVEFETKDIVSRFKSEGMFSIKKGNDLLLCEIDSVKHQNYEKDHKVIALKKEVV